MQQQQRQQGQRKNSNNKTTEKRMTKKQPQQHPENMILHNKCQIEQNNDIIIATIHDNNSSDNQINLRINDKKNTNTITKAKTMTMFLRLR